VNEAYSLGAGDEFEHFSVVTHSRNHSRLTSISYLFSRHHRAS
jgi:hypothetical protein